MISATYRELASRYPDRRYQVGRACAAAGYAALYAELDLLPDVSIAEEAREGPAESKPIFEAIMSQPTNLYNPSSFSNKHKRYANITEDWNIDDRTSPAREVILTDDEIALLYSPLPPDLPTLNKDLLILKAAYTGNIDRYARLRRPRMIKTEYHCLIRGIYHSITFAKWFGTQPLALDGPDARGIRTAINARFVMCNDLTTVLKAPDTELPYLVWYPHSPKRASLKELAVKRPEMMHQVARTCIAINYPDVWGTLNVRPDRL
ncbi:hypothetical protein B0T25DRAFT_615151 [Lasiosphaeria hispida]|uniref:Uncharacterized protein n=1 Tax=Lasiosphaeria hispida TaxID=260671 RepID=A0AAJ0H8N8_9PEZI|nr:hypothetical protein B0T25DRAFT_615151 [Lasiosphaeria hispida]